MPGSGVMNILDWRRKTLAGEKIEGITPLQISAQLEERAGRALGALPSLRSSAPSKELRLTLGDIEAMAGLARYYASKIRGAAALALYDRDSNEARKQEALRYLQAAVRYWQSYARIYTTQYTQPHLYNRVGFVDIPALTAKAAEDVEIARQWKPGIVIDEKIKFRSADQPFRK